MGLFIRTIGMERPKTKIGLANIAFDFKRFLYWECRPNSA
jgi:IS5 family transposase